MSIAGKLAVVLGPGKKEFKVSGDPYTLYGLQGKQIAEIAEAYPEFGEFFSDNRGDAPVVQADGITPEAFAKAVKQIDIGKMFLLGGGAIPAIIAAGLGKHQDEEEIADAGKLAPPFQGLLLTEIMKLSFPDAEAMTKPRGDGQVPFVEGLGNS